MEPTAPSVIRRSLVAMPITIAAFAPYGQVIYPTADGAPYGVADAQLDLSQGTPRFYLMHLLFHGLSFQTITRHQRCTQCLGSLGHADWYMAVAPPSGADQPDLADIVAFWLPGNCFIKLHVGTWHAGPYFTQAAIDFYNLELSDTNLTDHHTCNLAQTYGVEFEIQPGPVELNVDSNRPS